MSLRTPPEHDRLRTIEPATLERLIAEAISAHIGIPYDCTVNSISFTGNSAVDGADITIHLTENIFLGQQKP